MTSRNGILNHDGIASHACEMCAARGDDVTPYAYNWLCEECVCEILTHAPGYREGSDPALYVGKALAGWLDVWRAFDKIRDADRRAAIEACMLAGDAAALTLARTLTDVMPDNRAKSRPNGSGRQ